MELKKIASIILSFVFIIIAVFSVSAQGNDVLSFGQISVNMPEIRLELKGSGYKTESISATLDTEKLSVKKIETYNSNTCVSRVFLLVDLSTSMIGSFDLVKENIISFIDSSGTNDSIVLITFGQSEVKTILNGNEDKNTAISTVKSLQCNENGTLFYEALSKAYQLVASDSDKFDREYAIAFSDGIDVQKGNTTFDEVIKQYKTHALPLYAACSNNSSKESADRFGELARSSGGEFSIIKSNNDFDELLKRINDVTILEFEASNNYADGKEKQISIKLGSQHAEYIVPIVRSITDTTVPTVSDLHYDKEKDVFVISFSEKVIGATEKRAYKIVDSKGKIIEISDVYYSEKDDVYKIKTKTPVTKGKYTFEFSGIKDNSTEKNALDEQKIIEVKSTNNIFNLPIWAVVLIIVIIVLLVIAVICILIVASKRKPEKTEDDGNISIKNQVQEIEHTGKNEEIIKHHIKTSNSLKLRIRIKTGKSSEQNIETVIVSSLIVGRSDTCDIYIDDAKLSRQHFAIENDNGDVYILDLQSKNGTMLNGIRLNGRQRVKSGDKILAGLSDIVITSISG